MKVGIVGAGPGGLAAGVLLANQGLDVTIYEKEDKVGGRNGFIEAKGYKFDIGPTFFMMPFILEEIFAECGRDLEDYVELKLLEPYYQLVFSDGERLFPSKNYEKVKEHIAKLSPEDAKNFDDYVADNEKKIEKILPVLKKRYDGVLDLFSKEIFDLLPVLRPFTSLWDDLGKHFEDDRVKVGSTFQSKYLGMSPHNCPSLFSILDFTEYKWGVYHVKGGLGELAIAMSDLFKELGGKIETGCNVEEIVISNKQAEALLLEDGSKQKFDEVVMNADFAWGMKNLIPKAKRNKYQDHKLDKKNYSCSTFMLYLGLDKVYEDLMHHNVFIADDYERNFKEIEEEKVISEDPSFYVHNPSVTDDSMAPDGHSALYVLVPIPNLKGDIDWEVEKDNYRNQLIKKIEERAGIENLEEHIQYEKVISPLDWQEDMNVGYAACFNLGHDLNQMLIFRPRNNFECFDNMWLVGGGTNPGSGLPTIYESGRITAHGILEEHNLL